MNDSEINIAIAEWCLPNLEWESRPLPNYVNDLNAIHEAEMKLGGQETKEFYLYYRILIRVVGKNLDLHPICATARQRAEALLRTLSKWNE